MLGSGVEPPQINSELYHHHQPSTMFHQLVNVSKLISILTTSEGYPGHLENYSSKREHLSSSCLDPGWVVFVFWVESNLLSVLSITIFSGRLVSVLQMLKSVQNRLEKSSYFEFLDQKICQRWIQDHSVKSITVFLSDLSDGSRLSQGPQTTDCACVSILAEWEIEVKTD